MGNADYVLGIDFGTDSVRALIVNAADGHEVATAVRHFPRWKEGRYCDPARSRFRQHPRDHITSMEDCVKDALAAAPGDVAGNLRGIGVDTTGSSPAPVTREGLPLALYPEYEHNPNAMFVLWKDHTAVAEAAEINDIARTWGGEDFTRYSGGVYSSEWFWSKILHILREDPQVRTGAFSWMEHCDWVPALLTGSRDVFAVKRSRCAAGHKAMWHASFGGLPSRAFLDRLDPLLGEVRERLYTDTFTADVPAGGLCDEWAKRLGLPENVPVACGAFDAHMGAVGGAIRPYMLSKVIGTSTCDMLVAPLDDIGDKLVGGICGQVDGSIIPGMLGMEAGQSAFGDVYAWFRDMLAWPVRELVGGDGLVDAAKVEELLGGLIPRLATAAAAVPPSETGVVALDWLNGRRTPWADQALTGAVAGLTLGTTAPALFRALVEATAFGARKINERFEDEGVPIKGVIALGGVAKKSPFVMQVLADVLNREISVAASEQTCALGASMFAAVAGGVHDSVATAIQCMAGGFETAYQPDSQCAAIYERQYERYTALAGYVEGETARMKTPNG